MQKDCKINQQHLKKALLLVPLINIRIKIQAQWDIKSIGMSIKIIKINTRSRASFPLHARGCPTSFPLEHPYSHPPPPHLNQVVLDCLQPVLHQNPQMDLVALVVFPKSLSSLFTCKKQRVVVTEYMTLVENSTEYLNIQHIPI